MTNTLPTAPLLPALDPASLVAPEVFWFDGALGDYSCTRPQELHIEATRMKWAAAFESVLAPWRAACITLLAHNGAARPPVETQAADFPAAPAAPPLADSAVWIFDPYYMTLVPPPAAEPGFVPRFDKASQTWSQVEDHRGVPLWYADSGKPAPRMVLLGALPAGVTAVKPAPAIAAEAAAATAALLAYANGAQGRVLAKGSSFNVAAVGAAPVMILCDGTSATRADLALLALPTPGVATNHSWVDNNGVSTTLTDAEAARLALLVRGWVANTFATLALVLAHIQAGNLTTSAQIDALPWPTA